MLSYPLKTYYVASYLVVSHAQLKRFQVAFTNHTRHKDASPSRVTVLHIHNAIMAKDASIEFQKRGAPQCYGPTLSFNCESDQDPTFDSAVTEKTALLTLSRAEGGPIHQVQEALASPGTLETQESYIKDEQASLKRELIRAEEEVRRIRSVPLVNSSTPLTSTPASSVQRLVLTMSFAFSRKLLKPSSSLALHRYSNTLVDILPPEADSSISMLGAEEKPDVTYQDVGEMDSQKQEIREAVELPITHFDLCKKIGIDPPRGVLLYGSPGVSA